MHINKEDVEGYECPVSIKLSFKLRDNMTEV